jgi:hypothetical protein
VDTRAHGDTPCPCARAFAPVRSAPQMHVGVVIAGIAMACFGIGTLTLVACSNPGIVPKQTLDEMEGQRQRMEEAGMEGTFTVCRESATQREGVGEGGTFTVCRESATRRER